MLLKRPLAVRGHWRLLVDIAIVHALCNANINNSNVYLKWKIEEATFELGNLAIALNLALYVEGEVMEKLGGAKKSSTNTLELVLDIQHHHNNMTLEAVLSIMGVLYLAQMT